MLKTKTLKVKYGPSSTENNNNKRRSADIKYTDLREGHGAGLENVDDLPHVSLSQPHEGLNTALSNFNILSLNDVLQPGQDLVRVEGTKAEAGTPGLEGRNNLSQVVSDHTEPEN